MTDDQCLPTEDERPKTVDRRPKCENKTKEKGFSAISEAASDIGHPSSGKL